MKNFISAAVQVGATGATVGERFDISVQSVQNIKKPAGLVLERTK